MALADSAKRPQPREAAKRRCPKGDPGKSIVGGPARIATARKAGSSVPCAEQLCRSTPA
jgi:hypothetical protein